MAKLNVDLHSIREVFQRAGWGFCVPDFQRDYTWKKENVETLLNEFRNGVEQYANGRESGIFLGTIILFPKLRQSLPQKEVPYPQASPETVAYVIDGQQRLSTIALLASLLDELLEPLEQELSEKADVTELADAVRRHRLNRVRPLWTYTPDVHEPTRVVPKIIRQYSDHWSFKLAAYESPVGEYLANQLGKRVIESKDALNMSELDNHIVRIRREIRRDLLDTAQDEVALPAKRFLNDEVTLPRALGLGAPEQELLELILNEPDSSLFPIVSQILRLLAFSFIFSERCEVVVITSDSQDWALDVFQSLNSTGTRLTAWEAFRPTFLRSDNPRELQHELKETVDRVDLLFQDVRKQDTRTKEFLESAALYYEGLKLGRKFSEQFGWLRKSFEPESASSTRRLAGALVHVSEFMREIWYAVRDQDAFSSTYQTLPIMEGATTAEKEEIACCLAYLESARHSITRPLLATFYARVEEASSQNAPAELADAAAEFRSVVKSVSAFFTLWRAIAGTSGLPEVYRRIMRSSSSGLGLAVTEEIDSATSAADVAAYLREELEKKFASKKSPNDWWIAKASDLMRYGDTLQSVIRFCLIVAAHETIPVPNEHAKVKVAKSGTSRYLTWPVWAGWELELEVEHIAPQRPTGDWEAALYDPGEDWYQRLGNLTLLPADINSSVSNRRWEEKRRYYAALASADLDTVEELIDEFGGDRLSDRARELIRDTVLLHHLRVFTELPSSVSWSTALVEQRTNNLLEIIWNRLWGNWLMAAPD